jgi:N-methylhydantoinase B
VPERGIACSGGDLASVLWWGRREATGEFWGDGSPHPVGQGAHAFGDGAAGLLHFIEAATRFAPTEVWEARNPWLMEKFELATDSGGPGRLRGGAGPDMHFRFLEDAECTATLERTKNAPWGLDGGLAGRPNSARLRYPDGRVREVAKATGLAVPKGAVFEIACGGGGGYGDPAERDPQTVLDDVRDGYVSPEEARKHYPHAFANGDDDTTGARESAADLEEVAR